LLNIHAISASPERGVEGAPGVAVVMMIARLAAETAKDRNYN
jgi:hypothetical protein